MDYSPHTSLGLGLGLGLPLMPFAFSEIAVYSSRFAFLVFGWAPLLLTGIALMFIDAINRVKDFVSVNSLKWQMSDELLSQLSQLSISAQNQVIRVRIARMWDVIIPPKKIFLGVDLLLTDEEGCGMHATIKNTDAQFLRRLLNEGSAYEISRFQFGPSKLSYNSVHLDQIISFTRRTQFLEIHENLEKYPRHHFSFASFEAIEERANSNKFMSDVIGMLTYIGPILTVQVSGEMTNKRDVVIRLLSGENLKVTIWQNLFPQIREEHLRMTPKPVAIFAGTTVKTYMNELYLSTSSATKIFINLDIPETSQIKERYQDEIDPQPNHPQIEVRDATIAELLAMDPREIQHTKFHCRATIIELDAAGWYYNACSQCRGALRAWNDALCCTWHGKKDPLLTMRLNLRIRDETDEMGVVIFGKSAENLTGISLKNIPALHSMKKMDLPPAAAKILNQAYLLTIGLTNSAITAGVLGYKIFGVELLEPAAASSKTDDKKNEAESSTPPMSSLQCPHDKLQGQLPTSPNMSQIPSDLSPEESLPKKPKTNVKRKDRA